MTSKNEGYKDNANRDKAEVNEPTKVPRELDLYVHLKRFNKDSGRSLPIIALQS